MCRVKARIRKGSIPGERVAYIETAENGPAEVITCDARAGEDGIEVVKIAHEADRVLVELPEQTTAGEWRLWVPAGSVSET